MSRPHFLVNRHGVFVLTVPADRLHVCAECPDIHIRLFLKCTPELLREFAADIATLADDLEAQEPEQ